MTKLDSILKSRDITLSTKVRPVKAMVFPVVMYGCENWTVKKAECQRIDAFKLWCWRRLLQVPWTARRSSQSILKETSPGCSLEGLMLKLKPQYFGHLMRRVEEKEWLSDWTELNVLLLLLFSCSVVSDCLQPHGLQHARLLCLPELVQTHVHWVGDAIQPSHPLSFPLPAFNLSQHQGLFQRVSSSHQVAKILEFLLSFQWIFRTDFL